MVNKIKKRKIYGIGITGLVGSRIVELLDDRYEFKNLGIETGVDITNPSTLEVLDRATGEVVVLHLAAKTDVDGCEKDRDLGEDGEAWKINVLGTQNVVNACEEREAKLIYISTDFVFGGQNTPAGGYSEDDKPDPINWYGQTKYQGERIVTESGLPYLICRLAFPYRAQFEPKKDFFRAILEKLKSGEEVEAVTDQIITPTFIDDIAYALDALISQNQEGVYHLVGNQPLTPYDGARLIAQVFNQDESLIKPTRGDKYFEGRAKRPFKAVLKNDKIGELGVKMATFEEGLRKVKKQLITLNS